MLNLASVSKAIAEQEVVKAIEELEAAANLLR